MPCSTSGPSPYRWRTPRTAIPSAGRPGDTSGRPSDTGAPRVTPTRRVFTGSNSPTKRRAAVVAAPTSACPEWTRARHEEDRAQTGELGDVEPPVEAGGREGRPELVRHRRRGCLLYAGRTGPVRGAGRAGWAGRSTRRAVPRRGGPRRCGRPRRAAASCANRRSSAASPASAARMLSAAAAKSPRAPEAASGIRPAIWTARPVGGKGSGANYVNVAPCRHRLRAVRRAQAGSDRRRRYALPLHGVQEAVGHRADVRRRDRRGAQDPRREPGATVRQEAPGSRHPRLPAPLVQRRRGRGRPHRERAAGQAGRLSRGAARPGCFRPCAAWNSVPGCPVRRP